MRACPIVALLFAAAPAWAAEPNGCDTFKWPIERERAALTAADRPRLASGAQIGAGVSGAVTLGLRAPADAGLPTSPERAPKDGTFAGFARFAGVPKAGIHTVSLSVGAWIDVVQDGRILKPVGFSGAAGCEGIGKTMKYDIAAGPFVIQISGTSQDSVSLAVLPSD